MLHPNQPDSFGPWTVVDTLTGSGRTCYLVRKAESQPLHVLKPATGSKSIDREIEVLKRLTDHPGIITLVDYNLQAPTPYHVTEYCSGGELNYANFKDWSVEELSRRTIKDKFHRVFKALGFAHSQGVLLGGGLEIFLTENKEFVIGDIEVGRIWETHHLDTTDDIKAIVRLYDNVMEKAKRVRIRRLEKQREAEKVQRTLAQAQPSAPRRLAAE